ncbi:MAG: hypothetical protein JNN08_25230 [Bryobacterales bacterium]|jgi:hypothetical protein|nr:hypothetical protein [Bryobacterales bacterium]
MAYLIYGLLMIGGAGYLNYRGTGGWTSVTELKNVPKSIRDNPGSYRSHYSYLPRYYGGK